jgi:hypothetical protein
MPERDLEEGERVGRFVVLRDVEGRMHAVAATSVCAICEDHGGALLLLPGGRMIRVDRALGEVLGWLEVGVRP